MKRATKIAAIALLAGSALTVTSVSASAFGGKSGPGGKMGGMGEFMQMEFADIDLDKNGQITVDDLKAKMQARFAAADKNGDGALDLAEIKAQAEAKMQKRMADGKGMMGEGKAVKEGRGWMPSKEKRLTWFAEKMLAKRDADKNGSLSAAEVMPDTARLDRMIDRFDTDDDNAISVAEFDQAQKEIWTRMQDKGWGKHRGKHGGKHGGKYGDKSRGDC